MLKVVLIYRLHCPETGDIRYIGKTENSLETRLSGHLAEARGRRHHNKVVRWVRKLLARGLKPTIEFELEVPVGDDWEPYERERIAYYRSIGCDLLNTTGGGIGLYAPTSDVLYKMSKSAENRKYTPDGLVRAQENARRTVQIRVESGYVHSPETLEKIRVSKTGQKHRPETRQQMEASQAARRLREAEIKSPPQPDLYSEVPTLAHVKTQNQKGYKIPPKNNPAQQDLPL